jgi:phosphoribosylanthranilate isomerase
LIVQIYEIQTPHEAERCIDLGVDHVGSVLLSPEHLRQSAVRETIRLCKGTRAKSTLIPLFQGLDPISAALDYYQPDFIHLCDTLTTDEGDMMDPAPLIALQLGLKERFPDIKLMRSIPVPLPEYGRDFPTLRTASALEPVTDAFLTDTWLGNEPVRGFIGITGRRCDTGLAKKLVEQSSIPVILAGGLSPENVFNALREILPAGADSCTQTNRTDKKGRPLRFAKDYNRVKQFVDQVRRAQRCMSAAL